MGTWLALIGRSAVDTVTSVTLPVTVMLGLLAWLEASGRFRPTRVLAQRGWRQPVYSAAISAVPGCAGGIAVTRLFADGVVGYAGLWAAHLATSGDASFVLLVGRPLDAAAIFAFLFVLGAGVGMLSLRGQASGEGAASAHPPRAPDHRAAHADPHPAAGRVLVSPPHALWIALVLAATVAAILANVAGAILTAVAGVLAAAAIVLSLVIQRAGGDDEDGEAASRGARDRAGAIATAISAAVKDAAEITLWVAVADLAFFAVEHLWGLQVQTWLNGDLLPVTLIAIAVGMIPGCGPQIFLARLYTAGSLPFVSILANSVSQHGDAIFPLLSGRRRDALRVSVASVLVALAVGLVWFGAHGTVL